MSSYAQSGEPNEAMKVFHEMDSRDVKPDEFIMVSWLVSIRFQSVPFQIWSSKYQLNINYCNECVNFLLFYFVTRKGFLMWLAISTSDL